MLVTMMHDFYDALAYLEIYAGAALTERQQILKRVGASQKTQSLAHHTPLNYQHKFDLVEADGSAFWGRQRSMECTIELLPELSYDIGMKKLLLATRC